MLYSPSQFSDDVRLCERSEVGGLAGFAAMLVWVLSYASLYATNGLPMVAFLSRCARALGAPLVGGGVLCGFVVRLLRERGRE